MKLIDILKEIRILPAKNAGILPKEYVPFIDELTETFGETDSGFELDTPMYETYHSEYYEDEEDIKATMEEFAKRFNDRILVSNDTALNYVYIKRAPGAPSNSFIVAIKTKIEQGNEHDKNAKITVYTPYIDTDPSGEYFVGWFDINGNYYPDTEHFNENGEYIG